MLLRAIMIKFWFRNIWCADVFTWIQAYPLRTWPIFIYIYICITYNTYDTTNNLPPNCKLQWHSNTNLPAELMASPIEPKSKTPPVMYDTLQIIVINIDKVYYIAIPTISIIYILLSKSDLLQDFFKTSPWPIIGLKDDAAPAEP